MTAADSSQFKRFIAGLDEFSLTANEFQRTDVAPKDSFGNGLLNAADQQQLNNYIAGLDAPPSGGGPAGPATAPMLEMVPAELLAEGTGRTYRVLSAAARRGSHVTVIVEIDAKGNETAMSFSLRFDPSRLRFSGLSGVNNDPDAVPGSGAPAGTNLTLNARRAGKGLLGVLLDAPTSFSSGTRHLVELRFDIVPDAPLGPTSLFFTDNAIARCTTDIEARELHAVFENGQIEITPARANDKIWWMSSFAPWPAAQASRPGTQSR